MEYTYMYTWFKHNPKKHANPGIVIFNYFAILLAVFNIEMIQLDNSVFFIVS